MNEIRILKKLSHSGIVKLYSIYEMDDELCLVMEYIAGGRIFDEIVKTKGMSERDVAITMKQLFSILGYLRSKEVLHRDIKPENIMFSRDSHGQIKIKLIDFGLAILHSKREGVKKGGTAGYVAPEILNNEVYDYKADLYSAAVVMFTS